MLLILLIRVLQLGTISEVGHNLLRGQTSLSSSRSCGNRY